MDEITYVEIGEINLKKDLSEKEKDQIKKAVDNMHYPPICEPVPGTNINYIPGATL